MTAKGSSVERLVKLLKRMENRFGPSAEELEANENLLAPRYEAMIGSDGVGQIVDVGSAEVVIKFKSPEEVMTFLGASTQNQLLMVAAHKVIVRAGDLVK